MNRFYIREEPPTLHQTQDAADRIVGWMVVVCCIAAIAAIIWMEEAHSAERDNVTSGVSHTMLRAGQLIRSGFATEEACDAAMLEQRKIDATTKVTGSWRYTCREDRWTNVSYGPNTTPPPPACPASPEPRQQTCPSGYSGSFRQDAVVGVAPACVVTWNPSTPPTGACTPIPPPPREATISWTPPTRNTDDSPLTNLAGYRINYGQSAAALSRTIQIANGGITRYTVPNLDPGTWYFGVRAYTSAGGESATSNVVAKVVP